MNVIKKKILSETEWLSGVFPRPKQCRITGATEVRRSETGIADNLGETTLSNALRRRLREISGLDGPGRFTIRMFLSGDADCPSELEDILKDLPNREQAYVMRTFKKDNQVRGLTLAANTAAGLWYAALTLLQLTGEPEPGDVIIFPHMDITDWPDMEERGLWGEKEFGLWGRNNPGDIEWFAGWKLNVMEIPTLHAEGLAKIYFSGREPKAWMDEEFVESAGEFGIRIVPIIRHLEQLENTGIFELYPELAARAKPGESFPVNQQPLCFSQPGVSRILEGWMKELLAVKGISDIMVWLSENPAPCYCDRCRGGESFVREVKNAVAAFRQAAAGRTGCTLRLLTTQGSYEVNDRILEEAPGDVKITFYHGGLTYNSSHRPMIPPLLEEFAKSGKWLSVYPQLTNSWATCFPFTGPSFIHSRMKEFIEKGLAGFSGYVRQSPDYYKFNIAAAGEWGWNLKGRSPREFAESFAVAEGINPAGDFARWAEIIGQIEWDLAGSNTLTNMISSPESMVYDPVVEGESGFLDRVKRMRLGEGGVRELDSEEHLAQNLGLAERALEAASGIDASWVEAESRCVLEVFKVLDALNKITGESASRKESVNRENLLAELMKIDESARTFTLELQRWAESVNLFHEAEISGVFMMTLSSLTYVAEEVWKLGRCLGLEDPSPERRLRMVAEWAQEDFGNNSATVLEAEVSRLIHGPGEYDIIFKSPEKTGGIIVDTVELTAAGRSRDVPEVIVSEELKSRIARGKREFWLSVGDFQQGETLQLKIYMRKFPMNKPAVRGSIALRKSWRERSG